MLATLDRARCRRGEGWLFEPKWDGYRALALRPRRRRDARAPATATTSPTRFAPSRRSSPKALAHPGRASLDGEVCALDEQGRPSFSAHAAGQPGTPLVYDVFDVLEIDGEPLVDLPLTERRERLEDLLDAERASSSSRSAFDDGEALLEAATRAAARGRHGEARSARATAGASATATG